MIWYDIIIYYDICHVLYLIHQLCHELIYYTIELCHLYPRPFPSQFVEQICTAKSYSWKFVELVRAGVWV